MSLEEYLALLGFVSKPVAELARVPKTSEVLELSLRPFGVLRQSLDWTGRELRADKRGAIPAELLPILERLRIQPESWLDVVVNYDRRFRTVVGRVAAIRREALRRGRRWLQGLSSAAAIFL